MEHLENWSCTLFTFCILGEAATLEILKSSSFVVSVLRRTLVLLVRPHFKSFLLHTALLLVANRPNLSLLLCFASCGIVLTVPLFVRAQIPLPENHQYCLLGLFFSCDM